MDPCRPSPLQGCQTDASIFLARMLCIPVHLPGADVLQVWTPYLPMMYNNAELQIRQGPLPNNAKRNAIIYINSNCGANSGRHSLLTQLDQLLHSSESSISIHSYGSCTTSGSTARGGPDAASLSEFRSASWPLSKRKAMKLKYFGKYKFCVVRAWGQQCAHCR